MTSPIPPAETPPIFGSARLSEAEVRDALLVASPLLRYRWGVLVVSVLLSAFSFLRVRGQGLDGARDVLLFAIVMVVFTTIIFLTPRTHARKMLKELGANRGETDYRFDDEGITVRAPGTSSSVSWRVITRYRETPLTFLVYTSPGLASIVPKRAFNAADLDGVRTLLAASVRPGRSPKEGKR